MSDRWELRALIGVGMVGLLGCPGATTCYSYCADQSVVASSCGDAGAAAQCGSVSTEAFSGSTDVGGLSLVNCASTTNASGATVDAGCSAPTFQCVASSCKQDISCQAVVSCTSSF